MASSTKNGTEPRNVDNLAKATEKLEISREEVMIVDSDEDVKPPKLTPSAEPAVRRIAKKSTTPQMRQPPAASTRRQVALANSAKKVSAGVDRFLENFDPECSARERRKLNRKVNALATTSHKPGAVYDQNGIHIVTGADLCDCLQKECPGCHFPCPKCKSTKCGPECRCNRKFTYESIEYEGCDFTVSNPLK